MSILDKLKTLFEGKFGDIFANNTIKLFDFSKNVSNVLELKDGQKLSLDVSKATPEEKKQIKKEIVDVIVQNQDEALFLDEGGIIWYAEKNIHTYYPEKDFLNHLYEYGGSCQEWSIYYNLFCKRTNFDCKIVINEGIADVFPGHSYVVMYNNTHHCKLDQLFVDCEENR